MFNSNLYQIKKDVKSLCDLGFWDRIPHENIKIWLKQFEGDDEILLAHLILRNLIYRNERQMFQLMSQALRRAINHFSLEEDRCRFGWHQLLQDDHSGKKIMAGPVNFNQYGTGMPGKSGEIITSLIKPYFNRSNLNYPDLYEHGLSANEGFFIVDDAILSGNQIGDIISQRYSKLMLDENSSAALVVGLAHEDAISYLKTKLPNLRIFYGEIILKQQSFTSLSDIWIQQKFWVNDNIHPLELLIEISNRAKFNKPYYLGHNNQAMLLAYSYGTPDNSLQILHDTSEIWSPLVRR